MKLSVCVQGEILFPHLIIFKNGNFYVLIPSLFIFIRLVLENFNYNFIINFFLATCTEILKVSYHVIVFCQKHMLNLPLVNETCTD